MSKLNELAELGQAVWVDYIRRTFITSGDLQRLADEGVRGVTSNPSIFEKAIAGSDDYDEDLSRLVAQDRSVEEIYEALAFEDIRAAADTLRPVYDETGGADGYVSLEVSPTLAHDTEGTIAEARRLFSTLDRPNVMIKVPATPEGMPAIETLIGEGININVTLMFSLDHYNSVTEAYIAGLERLVEAGGDPSQVASVASFFVSRIDTAVDRALDEVGERELRGKIAIASAKVTYARFGEIFRGERWGALAAKGARAQRPLWASTSTKNPDYPDTMYVDSLIGPHTVNTVPPQTLSAYLDHGLVACTLEEGLEESQAQLAQLAELGVDLDAITDTLQVEGVAAFAQSFKSLMESIAAKRARMAAAGQRESASLGVYGPAVDVALTSMDEQGVARRIWKRDHTLWKPEPAEIANRLGWLETAIAMREQVGSLQELAKALQAEGYTDVLLLGMGGSSLAPEVFANVFGPSEEGLRLAVLDSTDPGAVLAHSERLDPERTLFVVATKSGGTVETMSFFKHFYNWTSRALGGHVAGEHFVAITDPGSSLAALAVRHDFRRVFLNDANIGGRYSVLSYFGLVPAALAGVDVGTLLDRAVDMVERCGPDEAAAGGENPGLWLAAVLAELARAGRDKVTFVTSATLGNFADWVEQLIAESTGKEGRGILPVVGEVLGPPSVYGNDRLFVYLRLDGDEVSNEAYDPAVQILEDAGHPVVRLRLGDRYDLGGQFFLWEFATAVAGHRLGINPFDQPDVEAAKALARKAVAAYGATGKLPEDEPAPLTPAALTRFLLSGQAGDYVALQAYVQPTEEHDVALQTLRTLIRDQLRLATTVGYGPRFLHSTGQLHKGDAGNGLFIQFTADHAEDVPIPNTAGSSDSAISFGVLEMAQALGDKQALEQAGRRVVRFHLGENVSGGLGILAGALS
ncbi:MAG: bifunctional transaldolase/phosoglucose isomerase [Anaerolineae bacterium]|jgi:transaldolase / glucose-6-phosphate isomerase